MIPAGERAFLVLADSRLVGMITQTDVMRRPVEDWPHLTVAEVMTPASGLKVVERATPLIEALRLLASGDFHQLPVLVGGQPVGLLTRAAIVRYLEMRAQLGTAGTN